MALAKSIVALPIDQGLNTKIDPKQEEPGFMRKAENVVYETLKLLKKRNGYDSVGLQLLDGTSISDAKITTKYKKELVLLTNSALLAYSPSLQKFTNKGTLYPSKITSKTIIKNANSQTNLSGLLVNNFEIYAWEDSSGGLKYSILDIQNKNFVVSDALLSASGFRPIVSNISNSIYFVYGEGTDLKFKKLELAAPNVLSAATTAKSDLSATDPLIDAAGSASAVFVAYNAAEASIFKIDADDNVSSTIVFAGEVASDALNITLDEQSRVVVAWSNGTDITCTIYASTFAGSILVPTQVAAVADVVNIGIAQSPTMSSYTIFWEVSAAETYNHYIGKANLTVAGVVSGTSNLIRSVGISAKPFTWNSETFLPVVHDSALQPTYFIIDLNGKIVTKFNNQNASGVIASGVLPKVSAIDTNNFIIPNAIKSRVISNNDSFYSLLGVNSTTINFNPTTIYQNAFLADTLHICSGVLKMYDGNVVVEHGFHVFPEDIEAGATATTGGAISDGDYAYVAVYRWVDNNGKDYQSAPTQVALEVLLTGGTPTQTQEIVVPTLRITEKQNVVIDLYRTEDAGTNFYKVTSNLSPVFNDTTVDTITIEDTLSDAALISKELLYTTGGVIENIPAPASNLITVFKNRLAVVGEQANTVYFSKQVEEGKPVEFTDLIPVNFDPIGGEISQIASMDEKFVAFQVDATLYISGDGPTNALQDNDFTKPEILASDIGCLDVNSVVLTPLGLMFKSRKGIWLLTKGLAFNYLGDKVELYNNLTVTSAQVVGELNQIRFITNDSIALVYNYNLNRWATFQNHAGVSSVVIENDYYYLRKDGELYKENRTSFADNSSPIKFRIETGWLYLTDVQGFQRIYHALLLGTYKSQHKLRVKVAYNFVEAFTDEVVVDVADFIDSTPYGGYSPYGAPTTLPYGGNIDQNLYQMRIDLARQKCQAIKLVIEDAQDEVGEGLSLSSITFRVGIKDTEFNLPATNKYGAK